MSPACRLVVLNAPTYLVQKQAVPLHLPPQTEAARPPQGDNLERDATI